MPWLFTPHSGSTARKDRQLYWALGVVDLRRWAARASPRLAAVDMISHSVKSPGHFQG